jgi:hypothetical protein
MAVKYVRVGAGSDSGTAPPVSGYWPKGWIRWNLNSPGGGSAGWYNVEAGTPGTWKEFALISQ